jgi:hypothetical protein
LYNLSQAALEAGHAEIFVVERAAAVPSAGISLSIQRHFFVSRCQYLHFAGSCCSRSAERFRETSGGRRRSF